MSEKELNGQNLIMLLKIRTIGVDTEQYHKWLCIWGTKAPSSHKMPAGSSAGGPKAEPSRGVCCLITGLSCVSAGLSLSRMLPAAQKGGSPGPSPASEHSFGQMLGAGLNFPAVSPVQTDKHGCPVGVWKLPWVYVCAIGEHLKQQMSWQTVRQGTQVP